MLKQTKLDSKETHLHLGCGKKFINGFTHIDLNDYDHIDYNLNVDDLSIFENASVDSIYCSHTLEYFNSEDANRVLQEWNRVLKINGILRLAVPDFRAIVEVYLKYKDISSRGILGPLYGKWKSDKGDYFYHKTAYDLKSLSDLLTRNGFHNIEIFNPFEIFGDSFDDYSLAYIPHMDPNGILISLNLQSSKI